MPASGRGVGPIYKQQLSTPDPGTDAVKFMSLTPWPDLGSLADPTSVLAFLNTFFLWSSYNLIWFSGPDKQEILI
jgi:hypothetical protein